MKIYLAARYSRIEELRNLREELQRMGHEVTSRWLDTDWERTSNGSSVAPPEYREKHCLIDLEDVRAADCCISFTEEPNSPHGKKGGRHVEFGVALQDGKRLIVVGFRENIFHHHPKVEFFNSQWDMLRALGQSDKEG